MFPLLMLQLCTLSHKTVYNIRIGNPRRANETSWFLGEMTIIKAFYANHNEFEAPLGFNFSALSLINSVYFYLLLVSSISVV